MSDPLLTPLRLTYQGAGAASRALTPMRDWVSANPDMASQLAGLAGSAARAGVQWSRRKTARKAYSARKPAAKRSAPTNAPSTRQVSQGITNAEEVGIRTLTTASLTWPSASADVGGRLGSTIRLSGIKFCEQFSNNKTVPIVVHWAVLQSRSAATTGALDKNVDFFRSTDGSTRSTDFSDTTAGGSFSYQFLYDCYGINPDKFYILTHKRKTLAGSGTDENAHLATWKFTKYMNFGGKKFTFDRALDTEPQRPIFRVYWWQYLRPQDWNTSIASPKPSILRNADSTMYFRPNFI